MSVFQRDIERKYGLNQDFLFELLDLTFEFTRPLNNWQDPQFTVSKYRKDVSILPAQHHDYVWEGGVITPHVLNFGTKCR